jgi:hypothetical protein
MKNQKAFDALDHVLSSIAVLTPPAELVWVKVDDDDPLSFAEFEVLICERPVKLTYTRTAEGVELSCCSVDELHAAVDAELQSRGFTSANAKTAITNSDSLELAPALRAHIEETSLCPIAKVAQ